MKKNIIKTIFLCSLIFCFLPVFAQAKTYTASENLIFSDDAQMTVNVQVYTKYKEIIIDGNGTIRVKFDIKPVAPGYNNAGKIYINDIARGVQRSSEDWATFTEDFSTENGDKIQLYAEDSIGQPAYIRNFRIYADEVVIPMYKCSGYSCVRDDVNGTYTTSNCDNACGIPPPASPFNFNGGVGLPIASTSDMLASVGTLFTDLWPMLAIFIGIPLAFFIIQNSIRLVPEKVKKGRR